MPVNLNYTSILNQWRQFIQNLVFDASCTICCRATHGNMVCASCLVQLPLVKEACSGCGDRLDKKRMDSRLCGQCLQNTHRQYAVMAFWYQSPIDQWVLAYKFHQDWFHGAEMVKVLLNRILEETDSNSWPQVLLPVPMYVSRLRQRGYNPAADIAYQLSRYLSIQVNTRLLIKPIASTPQMELPHVGRIKNVRNTFQLRSNSLPEHVAIVDDVVTTGATINEICRLLRKSKPNIKISVWALARTVRD